MKFEKGQPVREEIETLFLTEKCKRIFWDPGAKEITVKTSKGGSLFIYYKNVPVEILADLDENGCPFRTITEKELKNKIRIVFNVIFQLRAKGGNIL